MRENEHKVALNEVSQALGFWCVPLQQWAIERGEIIFSEKLVARFYVVLVLFSAN